MKNILIVDNDTGILAALQLLLTSEGYTVVAAEAPNSALVNLTQKDFDLVLIDLNYSRDTTSGQEGIELISAIRSKDDSIPIVVMTGWGTIEVAVTSMKYGANDFIQKPWENERLLTIIHNQLKLAASERQSHKLQERNHLLQAQVNAESCSNLVANSPIMQNVMAMLEQVAKTDVNVLLTGENGTGKSLFARYIHHLSPRNSADMTSVNMGAVSEALFESEMFGHVKGAFTDAKTTRIGRFELAEGGTLFLDEIANTPYSHQMKLLRVLEEKQFEKVGSNKTQAANVRLITATNSDLNSAMNEGKFRRDLYFRINTIEIEIPPLRKRREDILPLARYFLNKAVAKNSQVALDLSEQTEDALLQYDWPGNIRELSHVMERAQILCSSDFVKCSDLGLPVAPLRSSSYPIKQESGEQEPAKQGPSEQEPREQATNNQYLALEEIHKSTLEEIELMVINERLIHFKGNALKAAKSLGLSRSAFYRRLEMRE